MLIIFSFNCNNFSHSELYNTFFNSIKEILIVEMLSTEFLVNIERFLPIMAYMGRFRGFRLKGVIFFCLGFRYEWVGISPVEVY